MSETVHTIALTVGDPNGIGPEIAVKAANALVGKPGPKVILVGDDHVIRHYAERHASNVPLLRHGDTSPQGRPAIFWHPVKSLPPDHFKPGEVNAAAVNLESGFAVWDLPDDCYKFHLFPLPNPLPCPPRSGEGWVGEVTHSIYAGR